MVDNSIKVLVIEDDLRMAASLRRTLAIEKNHSFDVECADRLSTGLEYLVDGEFDIVLLDLMLPDSQRLDTIGRLITHAPNVPVVVLTGLQDEALAIKGVNMGAQDYLFKGQFDHRLLVRAIQYAIQRKNMEKTLKSSEERFRKVINKDVDAIVVVNREGTVHFANPAAVALFGVKKEKLIGSKFGFPIAGGVTTEVDIVGHRGKTVSVEMRVVEIEWEGEIAFLASLFDITDRKKVNEALLKAQEDLEDRVRKRTAELANANEELQDEITKRKQAEVELKEQHQHLEVLVDKRTAELKTINRQLKGEITAHRKTEDNKVLLLYDLEERVKELNCLYGVDSISMDKDITIEKLFQETLKIIPPSWREKENGCCRITFEGKRYNTENFRKTKWCLSADIQIDGEKAGLIEVCYLKKKPYAYEGPFFNEEKLLINSIAKRLADIVERKWSEKALIESEMKFRSFVETSNDLVFRLNKAGNIIYMSPKIKDLFEYHPDELIGKHFGTITPKEDIPKAAKAFKKVLTGKSIKNFEINQKDSAGQIIPMEINAVPAKKDGKIVGLQGIMRDITERKRVEAVQKQSEERLRKLIEKNVDAIIIVNKNNIVRFINPAAEKLFGQKKEKFLGTEFGFPLTGGETTEIEILARKGEIAVAEMRVVEIEWEGEMAYLASLRDMTERKKADEKLKQTADELEQSNRELEQFAYVASHDLQEPLRAISGYMQLLERRYTDKLGEDAKQLITRAIGAVMRMKALIEGLLDYSRVGTRGKPFTLIDSSNIFDKAVANLQATIKESHAVITHDSLPEVMGDGVQWIQLFQNLIGNAIKFRGDRKPEIHIGAEYQKECGEWLFSVRDNGIGIESQYAERIFQIFQRLHTSSDYPGTGIGLAVCKKIVERHGGRIWVESELGSGTTFLFTVTDTRGNKE